MRRRRLLAQLTAALLVAPLVALLPASPAGADPNWPQEVTTDVLADEVLTHKNGAVTASNCASSSAPLVAKTFAKDGTVVGSVPGNGTYTRVYACGHAKAVGPNGTVYGIDSAGYPAQEVVAYQGSTRSWERNLTSVCSWNNQTLNLIPHRMAVGTDGGLYVVSGEETWICGSRLYLTKLNAADGTVVFQQLLGSQSVYWLSAYNDGVVLYEHYGKVRYFEHDGDERPSVQVTETEGTYQPLAATMDGRVFIAFYTNPNGNDPCYSFGQYISHFAGYGPNGKVLDYDAPSCSTTYNAGATPEGGVAMVLTNPVGSRLVSLDPTGEPYRTLELAGSEGARNFGSYATVVTDTNGNVLLTRGYWRDPNYRYKAWQFRLFEPYGLVQRAEYYLDRVNDEVRLDNLQVAVAPGRMYLAVTHCTMYGCSNSHPRYVYAGNVAELGMDYPRGAALGVQAANPTKKHVALGDSYSSGEGVEPFDPATEKDAPDENRCHRSIGAYAKLLDQDASVPLQLTNFVACSGAVTDNIHTSSQWTQQKQVLALSQETDIVTITIGGNDVGFKEFAIACVMPNDNCSTVAYADAMEKIEDELPGKLDTTYAAIAAQIPSSARVLVLGYPRVIPYDDGSLPTCGALFAEERMSARQVTTALNSAISAAVARAGSQFEFVNADTIINGVRTSPFAGHEFCSEDTYFVGLDPVNQEYSLHPNAQGQAAYAELVRSYLASHPE